MVKYTNLQNLLIFMDEDKVFVAKEYLPCFLEVDEDLNIRCLSEKNAEGERHVLKEKNVRIEKTSLLLPALKEHKLLES